MKSNNKKEMRKCDVARIINHNNKIWENASKKERRVLIAKDVLAQIKNETVIPEQCHWVTASLSAPLVDGGGSLQEAIITSSIPQCRCCALGGMMLSAIKYCNSVVVDKWTTELSFAEQLDLADVDNNATRLLYDIFDRRTIRNIEAVFEKGMGNFTCEEFSDSDVYPDKLRNLSSKDRMIAIMQHIIDNNGIFTLQNFFKKFQ